MDARRRVACAAGQSGTPCATRARAMGYNSFAARLRSLDAYRKVSADVSEGTPYGGVISLVCAAAIVSLTASELISWLAVDIDTHLFVDISSEEPLLIHMNVTFPKLPCGVASLDKQDAMGLHVLDVGAPDSDSPSGSVHQQFASSPDGAWASGITKMRLAPSGTLIASEVGHGQPGFVSAIRQMDANEGCQFIGSIEVNKVPGNWHVSAHTQKPGINPYKLDVTHTIHHLSFGDKTVAFDPSALPAALMPLNGQTKKLEEGEIVEHYIKVVPTTFQSLAGAISHSYQFTAHSNSYRSNQFSALPEQLHNLLSRGLTMCVTSALSGGCVVQVRTISNNCAAYRGAGTGVELYRIGVRCCRWSFYSDGTG